MARDKYDFSGYATKNNIRCSDGKTILKDAFKHNDGKTVPLVWQHVHDDPRNVLGHALLENREDGVYAYGTFNETESGQIAKELAKHGDVTALSIYANSLKQQGKSVMHGEIREVSLVLAGANPGALIENLNFSHGDGTYEPDETEAIIYSGIDDSFEIAEQDNNETIQHAAQDNNEETVQDVFDSMNEKQKNVVYAMIAEALSQGSETPVQHADASGDKTVEEVFNTFSEEQKQVVYYMIGAAIEENAGSAAHSNNEGDDVMKFNVFDQSATVTEDKQDVLTHSDMMEIIADAKRYGSLKDSMLAHGIEQIDYLFPDPKNMTNTPIIINRDMGWVPKVMGGTHKSPFSRIKSILADLTEDEARARGYIKGKMKKEEVFGLLKRTTTPQTVYKKQKLERDDVIDITDFDVVAWLKTEMRTMLDEEIARAILVGDGRPSSSDDKINEANIRPIWKDDDLYTIKTTVEVPANATAEQRARAFIRASVKSRKDYKGSGSPVMFMTEDMLTDCLLIEDTNQRVIYDSEAKLATALRVREIITVPVMEGLTRTDGAKTLSLMGIVVNLDDYNVGADKGGAVNMFEDFDIDYNAQKYLIETRCSGALIKPYSAIALEIETQG